MKNKKIIFIFLFLYLFKINSLGEEFKFESSEIQIIEKGNVVIVEKDVKILAKDNLKIEADKSKYNKKKNSLVVNGNVKIIDENNGIIIRAEKINYYKNDEILFTEGKSLVELEKKYSINSSDLNLNRNSMKFSSKEKTIIKDDKGYNFILDEFSFDIKNKILVGKNVYLKDLNNNKYYLEKINLNLNNYNFSGEKLNINFDNSLFGNKENEPRLTGEKISDNKNESTIYKGSFTTCKKNEENCPPWLLLADEIKHKKKEKIIEYRNAWLEIYKKPVIYFPYFYHPDPTVKRQSGFLAPTIINSSVSGTTFKIPYYKVISKDKDLTISPQIFFDKSAILQTEYRQAYKNSKLITDLSLAKDEKDTKAHFFSNIKGEENDFKYEINLEKVSNDKYLKINKITSPLINSYSELNSFIQFDKSSDTSFLSSSVEIFENLNKKNSDRYEYVLPNITYSKNLKNFENSGRLEFNSFAFQKYFNTNQYEASLINDIIFKSNKNISKNGFINSYTLLFRNSNSDLRNSLEFENSENFDLLSILLIESKLPLRKVSKNNTSLITPIISARFSPNKTKNIKNLDRKISYSNVYSLDRLGKNDMVEGRYSLTLGNEYSLINKNNKEIFNLSVANVLRNTRDDDLPIKSTLGNKRSDIIGLLKYVPTDNFNLEYQFSLDNNLKHSNFDIIKSNIKINNFITSFEYFEEDNVIGNKSYISNETKYNIDKNKSMSFEISKNLDKNITDYYNLIYEYKNDCMTAALEYNKTFYEAEDLESDQNIFFTIKIIPFGKLSSPSIN